MGLFNFLKRGKNSNNSISEPDLNDVVFYDDDDDDCDETLSVYDAADIWASSGFDEDRMFGYTQEELEEALK